LTAIYSAQIIWWLVHLANDGSGFVTESAKQPNWSAPLIGKKEVH
jgi:hypothetical protein